MRLWQTLTADTKGTKLFCTAWSGSQSSGQTDAEQIVKVDATPPVVSAAVPERPPDYGGWFNHPVTFAMKGSDATSGIAACSTATYCGPDGAGVLVTAGLHRRSRELTSCASFPLNYDATPPRAPAVTASPSNGGCGGMDARAGR